MTTVEFAFSVPVILLGLELAALIGDLAGAAKRSPGRGDGDNERRGTASTQSGQSDLSEAGQRLWRRNFIRQDTVTFG